MDDFCEFIEWVQDDQVFLPIPRQILRDNSNPLEKYTNTEILQRYRFSRNSIQNVILPLVYPPNLVGSNHGLPVPPITKLCSALRFYATGSFQKTCGDLHKISQSTICRVIEEVSEILSGHLGQFVKFPGNPEELSVNRNLFFNMAGFPGVTGCVDGTHVEIRSPGGNRVEYYRNRKGWMSLNVQVVAGPRYEILDIVIRWPGSAHDSRIFNSSAVKMKFDRHLLTGILLGDSAYAQSEYLFTPVLNPTSQAEQRYNQAHIRTRNVVERTFGIWKGRFRCLATALNCKLIKTTRIIAATSVLHNIAISEQDNLIDGNFLQRVVPNDAPPIGQRRGNLVRAAFIQRHFANNN